MVIRPRVRTASASERPGCQPEEVAHGIGVLSPGGRVQRRRRQRRAAGQGLARGDGIPVVLEIYHRENDLHGLAALEETASLVGSLLGVSAYRVGQGQVGQESGVATSHMFHRPFPESGVYSSLTDRNGAAYDRPFTG